MTSVSRALARSIARVGEGPGARSPKMVYIVGTGRTLLLLASLVATGLLGSPFLPAKAKATRAELALQTSITAERTAGSAVRLPGTARLSTRTFGNRDVALKGGTDVVAVALVKEPVSSDSPQWIAARWPWCSATGCTRNHRTVVEALNWESESFDDGDVILPPGDYRIYLLTNERSATAKLRFRELSGDVALRASQPSFGRAEVALPATTASDAGEASTALDQEEMPADGLHLLAAAVETPDRNYGGYLLTECLTEAGRADAERLPACTSHQGADTGGPRLLDEVWNYRTIARGAYAATVSFARAHTSTPRHRIRFAWAWLAYE